MMTDESADIRTTIMEVQKRSPPPPPRQMRRRRERQQQQQGRLRRRHQYDHIKFVVLFVIVYTSLLLRQDSTTPHDSSTATTTASIIGISSVDDDTAQLLSASSNFHRRQLMRQQEKEQQPRTLKKKKHLPLDGDYSSFPCDSLYEIPESLRCDFVQTCNDGDGLFVQSIFCSSSSSISFRTRLLIWSAPLLLFLIVLFRILGSTAEEFFSPGLEMLSIKLHFPERFAGVTLLSLGNGAPDVASTVSALMHDRKQGYLLALGELTGASMVASTVIVGAVTYHSISPVVCQGALIRDVVMFVITMITVYFAFDDGSIDVGEIRTFLVLYFAYVLIVLAADIYQKSRRHQRPIGPADSIGSEKDSPDEATSLLHKRNRSHSIGSYELGQQNEQVRPVWERGNSWDALTDYSQPIFNRVIRHISNYNEVSPSSRREGDNNVGHDFDIAAGNDDDKQNNKQRQQQFTHEKHHSDPLYREYSDQAKAAGWGDIDNYETEPLMVFHPHHGGIVDLKHTSLLHTGRRLSLTDEGSEEDTTPEATRISVWRELVDYFANFWNETFFSDEYNIIEKFLMVCELPATILRLLTIPVPCDGYYCRSLLAFSTVLCPFWLWYYLSAQFDVNIVGDLPWVLVLLILAALLVLGLLILRYAPCGEIPPRLSVAVPIVLVGFVASAAWLDYVADKIVSLLDFFGIICGIPSTIMGLTVLAWGNASQDLVANMTVAHKGLSTMAITACFAGPVCTMLIGLGLGLFVLNSARPGKEIVVHLNNTLRIGFLFCVLNGVLVIVSGVFVGRGIIPKKYGSIAAVLYFLYVVASLSF